jgi:hypothetical protein
MLQLAVSVIRQRLVVAMQLPLLLCREQRVELIELFPRQTEKGALI